MLFNSKIFSKRKVSSKKHGNCPLKKENVPTKNESVHKIQNLSMLFVETLLYNEYEKCSIIFAGL